MSWRATAVLWVIAMALVVAALWARNTRDGVAQTGEPIASTSLIAGASLVEFHDGLGTIVLRHDGSVWSQVQPFAWPVDSLAVHDLLGVVERLAIVRSVEGASADSPADAPRVQILTDSGDGVELALGERAPGGRAWLFRRDWSHDGPGPWSRVTVRDRLHDLLLSSPPRQWRDPTLLPGLGADCTTIELASPGLAAPLRATREGASWRLESPVATRADTGSIEAWMDALARLRASQFVVDAAEGDAYGLRDPVARLRITSIGRPATELVVGGLVATGVADRYATIEGTPTIVRLDEVALRRVQPNIVALVDARATAFRPFDIFGVRWIPSGRTRRAADAGPEPGWEIHREGSGWSPADHGDLASAVLSALCDARATDISFQSLPEGTRRGTMELFDVDGALLASIPVGRELLAGLAPGAEARWALESEPGVLRIFHPAWAEALRLEEPASAAESPESVTP
ncbi:MAG: DUF4340 domain-containing protein [Planctomycetota bacterium]|nr:DUF4340 domain-containing protein [Planctomycetota bacterium]MDA1106641.1 DUF4340 domain-containing protein [Planctomycetota bacterium]